MQYGYSLYYKNVSGGGTDQNGNPIGGNVTWILLSKCRDEKANAGKSVTINGVVHNYSAMIFAPYGCPKIKPGESLQVREKDGTVRLDASCLLFDQTDFHCRIWV